MTFALIRRLDEHARLRPDALALREVAESGAERTLSWRQLRDAAFRLAARLRRAPTGVVMICSPNRAEFVAALLGGLAADAPVLPVSPAAPAAELVDLSRRLSVSTLIGSGAALDALSECVAHRIPLDSIELDGRAPPAAPPEGSGSILLQSSGTTGLPKIVRRGAAALDAVGDACRAAIGIDESDAMLVCIPLHHSYGIDQGVLTATSAGCSVELHPGFDPARASAALAERRISVLPGVPLMFDALARRSRADASAPALRRAFSAGSPLPRRVFERFARTYGLALGQIYGATEFGSVTWNDPECAGFDPEGVGQPMQGVRIRIVDPHEPRLDRPLAAGEEGRVAVAAPSLLSEYLDGPDCPTHDGFFLSEDLGRLDERGSLALTGRTKLLVDVGGRKVNPLEVESVLARHPAVREAVAVAVPYTDTARRLKVIVVPEPGFEVSGEELRRFAREHLTPYKVPRTFEIRKTVPRSPTGKILRREL
ncbi:MAG: class I adenylate-forming enzyme family protein [Myxococcota bacterium]